MLFPVRSPSSGHANNGSTRAIPIFRAKLKLRGSTLERWGLPDSNWKTGVRGIRPSTTGAKKASQLKNGPNQSSRGDRVPNLRWNRCCWELMRGSVFRPHFESNDRKDCGDIEGANKILMNLCHADLRCLDAHAHLGNIAFDH